MAAGLLGVIGAAPAQAAINDRPAYTWNMQGDSSDGDSKWTFVVGPMTNSPSQPVIALQEVGAGPPPSAQGTVPQVLTFGNGLTALPAGMAAQFPPDAPAAQRVQHTQWRYGTGLHDVYYLQTDRNGGLWTGGRVNLAIVTPRGADEVVVIPTPGGNTSNGALRATLGVRLGTTWYFSVHAASGGGANVPNLMTNINIFINAQNNANPVDGREALVLGDFNRVPAPQTGGWVAPAGMQIVAPNGPTQHSGNTLDWGVMVDPEEIFPQNMVAQVQPTIYSDHDPVLIQQANTPTPTASAVPVFATSQVVENVGSGAVLDVANQSTADLAPYDFYRYNGQSNQSNTVLGYSDGTLQFKSDASGKCMDISHSDQNPGSGSKLSLWACVAYQASQLFKPKYKGNGEFLLQSVLLPLLCLNVASAQANPNVAADAILYNCDDTAKNETFFFGPANLSHATSPLDPHTLIPSEASWQNMSNGGVLDVANAGTANNTAVDSWQRNGNTNQGWDTVWQPDGSVSFRNYHSGRCIDLFNSTSATVGNSTVVFDCTGQTSQDFLPIALTDGQFEFASALVPDACLTASNSTADPSSGTEVIAQCVGNANQVYTAAPFDPSGSPSLPTDPDFDPFVRIATPDAGEPAQRVGYYTSWSTYANAFYPKNLDTEGIASKLTVLNYAFENIDPTNLTCMEANKASSNDESDTTGNDGSSDAFADYQKEYDSTNSVDGTSDTWSQPLRGNFNQLKELKVKYPNLKVLLSIGGWTYSKFFSDAAATDASRKKFVSSCIDMYIKGNLPTVGADPAGGTGAAAGIFDGFDIDWEFPGSNSGHLGNHVSAQDGANYTALLNEFRTELDALGGKHYTLSAALPAGPTEIANLNIPSISSALDLGDVMTYDFHGGFEPTGPTNFQAPLDDSPDSPAFGTKFTANDAITSYLNGGYPAGKLTLGVPFYGRGWTGVPDGGQHGRYQTATGPTPSFPLSLTPGVADWKELEAAGKTSSYYYDADTKSSWIYDGNNFWSVDTPDSLADKRQYIADKGLGGVMMYSLEADDANSTLLNAATGFTGDTPPSTPAGPPTGPIQSGYAGKCVDIAAASSANGTAVQLYDCNGTNAQNWTVGSDGTLQALGKCMDVTAAGTANGTQVQLYDCNGTGSQKWQKGTGNTLVNPQSGRCLDATGPSSANGTRLQIWDCSGSINQQWTLPS
jgi:GH18 family chitinase